MAFDPNVYDSTSLAENYDVALDDLEASVVDSASVAESNSSALDDLGVSSAEVISLAEYKVGKVEDPDISVNDSSSLAEDVKPNLLLHPSVNDTITITEDVDQDTGGEGATEVEDGTYTEESCGAAGIMSKAILPMKFPNSSGYLNISVAGTFTATVVLQRSFDRGVTWRTVASYTSATETNITDKEIGVRYRIGIPTTYTSGTADVRLGIGGQQI